MGGWRMVVESDERARPLAVRIDRSMGALRIVFGLLVLASAVELVDEGRVVGEESIVRSTTEAAGQSRAGLLFAERVEEVENTFKGVRNLVDSFAVVAEALE